MTLYLISYDIEDNRERLRLAKILLSYGERVQRSVFECDLDEGELAQLLSKIGRRISLKESDSVRIYALCERDEKRTIYLGAKPARKRSGIVI